MGRVPERGTCSHWAGLVGGSYRLEGLQEGASDKARGAT